VPPFGPRPSAGGRGSCGAGLQTKRGDDTQESTLPPAILAKLCPQGQPLPDAIAQLEPAIVERVVSEILDSKVGSVTWDSIAGLQMAKDTVREVVVWPMMNPELFSGFRAPPKGLLLFGPPGTGKTLIGQAIASECGATFFSISASSLTSKYIGDGEKTVRCLFAVARCLQPSVIFLDEIDALLSSRKTEGEHEASRRMKNEFLVQMEGTDAEQQRARVLLVGATNRPQELDEAARRRLPKQLYIPLPCPLSRAQLLRIHLGSVKSSLTNQDRDTIVDKTQGYSGSDMRHLVQAAANVPVRELSRESGSIIGLTEDAIRPVVLEDFRKAFKQVKRTVKSEDLQLHEEWNSKYGMNSIEADDDDGDW